MADAIVQTIKIEVEGADQAAAEIKKVGQATEEVQATAASTAGGTAELGKGLDQVAEKSGVSSRELRSLGKIMKEMGAGEIAGTAIGFARIAMVLGPIGVAAFAVAEAFSFVRGKMKEAEEQAKAVVTAFATIAKISAEMHPEKEGGWGATAAGMKEVANNADLVAAKLRNASTIVTALSVTLSKWSQENISALTSQDTLTKAIIINLEKAGVSIRDLMADEKKLGQESQKALLVLAKMRENLSPIEKSAFDKGMKGAGFSEDQIKSIEKGPAAFEKTTAAAKRQQAGVDQLSTSWDKLNKTFTATSFTPPPVEDWSNLARVVGGITDVITKVALGWKKIFAGGFGFFGSVLAEAGRQIVAGLVSIGSSIAKAVAEWVSTKAGNAWQWIVDTAASVWEQTKALAQQAYQSVVTFVTTAPGNAWQWIKDTAASVWEQTKSLAQQAWDAVARFVTTAPGNAWQWIKDTAASVWEQVKTGAQQAWDAVVRFVTTPVANAWQWIKDTWNANVPKVMQIGGAAAGGQVGATGSGFAGGGLLGGRGSGTSDSNLAWVSRGEYITPARAVQQPGVLAFLDALRRSGGNLRDVLDGMGRFAIGGMVRAPISIPAFAGGGMSHVTIQFPGLPEITGLRASSGVVDELRQAAAMAQVRSGGRKPSRYS